MYCKVECKNKKWIVVRIRDGYTLSKCFDKKHANAVADKFNYWNRMGWGND